MRDTPLSTVEVRLLGAADAAAYHALRLEGLRTVPTAFGADESEEAGRTLEQVAARLTGNLPDIMTFGAFLDRRLVGIATLLCNQRVKTRHRADIVGMYVTASARGLGIARALLEAAIAQARAMPQVEAVALTVTVGNDTARRLYERLGFAVYATEPRALKIGGAYYDMHRMILTL